MRVLLVAIIVSSIAHSTKLGLLQVQNTLNDFSIVSEGKNGDHVVCMLHKQIPIIFGGPLGPQIPNSVKSHGLLVHNDFQTASQTRKNFEFSIKTT